MKRFLFTKFLLVGLTFSFCFYAQDVIEKNELDAKRKEKIEKPNAIFFSPISPFSFQYPNFHIGYERFLAKKLALQIEGGIIFNQSLALTFAAFMAAVLGARDFEGILSEPYSTNKGFHVKGSVKYVFIEKRKFKLYVSPELFYSRTKSEISRSFNVSDPNFEYSFGIAESSFYDQDFYNDEEKMGVNFKTGAKIHVWKSLYVEPHLGIGFAYRNVIQTGRENLDDKLYDILEDLYLGFLDKASPNKWVPTIPFNVKIGYRF